jgi:hypothetical protein
LEENRMADEKKGEMSRRSFLRNAAVGAAAVGAAMAAPNVVALTQNVGGAGSAGSGGDAGSPMVAYVKDASAGTVVVMWGSKEAEIRDPTLVSRIMRYTRG